MTTRTLFGSRFFPAIVGLCLFSAPLRAQTTQAQDPPAGFGKIEQMVPMRDGVKLHTIIYAPKSHREPLPLVFNRTPYAIDNVHTAFPGGPSQEELAEDSA